MNRIAWILALVPLLSCGPKKVGTVVPVVGWQNGGTVEAPWPGTCYFPPAFAQLDITARKTERQKALEGIKAQWLGQREDGVSFDANMISDLEVVLLGRPDRIEEVTLKNLDFCKRFMAGQGSAASWETWLSGLPAELTAGECGTPFTYQLIQYLDIMTGWQQPIPFCKGDHALIEATANDSYRIVESGPWINAEGDTTQNAVSSDYPCSQPGCFPGQLIGRFVTEAGVETIFPIGIRKEFEAPEHGTMTWQINDATFYDNAWRKEGTIVDHTTVTVSPAVE